MPDNLLISLQQLITHADNLLTHTELDDLQRKFINAIFSSAQELRNLIISLPDSTWERTHHILNFEARSHLASIMGYAEEMLDDPDTPISDQQKTTLQQIQTHSERLLD